MSQQSNTLSQFKLVIDRQSASPIEHSLQTGRSVFIGSGGSCGISVNGDGVCDIHCLIDVDAENVSIQDWASDTGTRVNGKEIDDKILLNVGDTIQLGALEFILQSTQANSGHTCNQDVGQAAHGAHQLQPPVVQEPTTSDLPGKEKPLGTNESHEDAFSASQQSIETELAEPNPVEFFADEPAVNDDDSFSVGNANSASDDMDPEGLDEIVANTWDSELGNWDIDDDEMYDAETVNLLKSEIEDLRIQLAARDEQIALLSSEGACRDVSPESDIVGQNSQDLVDRMDDLLAEMAEHDERVKILQELLETAELQNQAEQEERNCLENWLGEIEQRIGQRESEWKAESDGLRKRLEGAISERDQAQNKLQEVAKRYNMAPQAIEETMKQLQQQNAALQNQLETSQRETGALLKQLDKAKSAADEQLQEERAKLAKERADVSRMRFQLSKELSEINETEMPEAKDQPDREFAHRLRTLREHLREIHEEEKEERETKGESLLGRISGLWKRVEDDRF